MKLEPTTVLINNKPLNGQSYLNMKQSLEDCKAYVKLFFENAQKAGIQLSDRVLATKDKFLNMSYTAFHAKRKAALSRGEYFLEFYLGGSGVVCSINFVTTKVA